MAKESTYAQITPTLDDAARLIDDPAGTPRTRSALLSAILTLFTDNLGALAVLDSVAAGQIDANAVGSSELADNAVDTNAIQAAAVTLAKLANAASDARVLGRASGAGVGAYTELTAAQIAAIVSGTLADSDVAALANGWLTTGSVRSQLTELAAATDPLAKLTEMKAGIYSDWDDFQGQVGSTTIGGGKLGWLNLTSGGTVAAQAAGESAFTGYWRMSTGTAGATDRAGIRLNQLSGSGIPVFRYAFRARQNVLNNVGVQDATTRIGLMDGTGGTAPVDGMWFEYSAADNTWHLVISDNSVQTNVDSDVVVDTNVHWFEVISDGVEITFLIDDVECANSPLSGANLPDAGADFYGPQMLVNKTTGTGTAITADIFRFFYRVEV